MRVAPHRSTPASYPPDLLPQGYPQAGQRNTHCANRQASGLSHSAQVPVLPSGRVAPATCQRPWNRRSTVVSVSYLLHELSRGNHESGRGMSGLPEYGSPEWHAADDVTKARATILAARCWHALTSSPHVSELLTEWLEWFQRGQLSESTAAISAAVDWRAVANAPTYTELECRRSTYAAPALTPRQIRARASASWAAFDMEAAS